MNTAPSLHLYEEVLLLALRDEKGTALTAYVGHLLAGAVLAEFLLDGTITMEPTRKQMVDVVRPGHTGDPILDECLEKVQAAKRRASLKTWIARLAAIRQLRHKAAMRLCEKGVLRCEEHKILLVFTQKVYPEIDPNPERRIQERLRTAVFESSRDVDPRTLALLSLAAAGELVKTVFDRKELKSSKQRIKSLIEDEPIGKATKAVIQAQQAAATAAM